MLNEARPGGDAEAVIRQQESVRQPTDSVGAKTFDNQQNQMIQKHSPAAACRMKWYETGSRYLLGSIYLFGAIDGALFLFFGIYIHGKPAEKYFFLLALQRTTYFWAFMKLVQLIGAMSLLANYKPALGVALLIPISSVLCLFYLFELPYLIPFGLVIVLTTVVLCRAYSRSYTALLDGYS